jgi:hypothetical protein
MSVSTQLRLITKSAPAQAPSRPLRARANPPRRPATRRAVHWEGSWRIDERTRAVGRAGVASARAALAAAVRDEIDELDELDGVRRAS